MSATNVRPPYGISASNSNFEVRKFTGGVAATETTHKTDPLPDAHWSGKWIGMLAVNGTCHFAFSKNASAEVDRAVAATEAGATSLVGMPLSPGIINYVRLPTWPAGSSLYFARESDTVGTIVYMWLSDEPGLKGNP